MSHRLSDRFRTFAEAECRGSSTLYYLLSHSIAQDETLLDIAGQAAPGQPVPNLLFAAVHYLLLSGAYTEHGLTAFYPTCSPSPAKPEEAYPYFKDFIIDHSGEIIALLSSRRVQTNEVRRCAYLFPAFLFAVKHSVARPLALVEIGTSAGLNLIWDAYQYTYGDGVPYGDLSSEVIIRSSFRGDRPAILSAPLPQVSQRIGIDLNIVDTSIPDQAAWLRALIWPEHHERRNLMEAALRKRNKMALDLRVGDGFGMLSKLAEEIPEEALMCIYHTHVANQISKEARQSFLSDIDKVGQNRDIIHLFNNIKPNFHLTGYRRGQVIDMPLARTDGHARWIEWMQNDEFC
jgi:hypothetical protein